MIGNRLSKNINNIYMTVIQSDPLLFYFALNSVKRFIYCFYNLLETTEEQKLLDVHFDIVTYYNIINLDTNPFALYSMCHK